MKTKLYFEQSAGLAFNELNAEVRKELGEAPVREVLLHKLAGMVVVLLYFLFYVLAATNTRYLLLGYFLMGLTIVPVFLTVIHEAVHGAFFQKKKWNNVLVYLLDIMGANGFIWKKRHILLHHNYANVAGWDADIEQAGLFRIYPHDPIKKIHRYQPLLFAFAYPLYLVNWVFVRDFKDFFSTNRVVRKLGTIPKGEFWKLVFFKLLYVTYTVAVPVMLGVHWLHAIVALLVMLVTAGTIALSVLLTPHVNLHNRFPLAGAKGLPGSWVTHQFETTNDIDSYNWFTKYFMGNFNFHLAHHLFPNASLVLMPRLTDSIKCFAMKHGLRYRSYKLGYLLWSHFALLNKNATTENIFEEDM